MYIFIYTMVRVSLSLSLSYMLIHVCTEHATWRIQVFSLLSGKGLGFSEQHQDRSAAGWDQSDDFRGSKCQGGWNSWAWRTIDIWYWPEELMAAGKVCKLRGLWCVLFKSKSISIHVLTFDIRFWSWTQLNSCSSIFTWAFPWLTTMSAPIASRQGIVFSQFGSMLEYLGLQDVADVLGFSNGTGTKYAFQLWTIG